MTEIKKFFVEIDGDVTRVVGTMMFGSSGTAIPLPDRAVATCPWRRGGSPEATFGFEWAMPTSALPTLDVLITMPGRLPGVRVNGSIDPDGVRQPIGAVRTRMVPEWGHSSADLPSCRLRLEAVGADASDDDLRHGYSTTLLDLGPEGWRHLRNVVAEASAASLRSNSDLVTPWDNWDND